MAAKKTPGTRRGKAPKGGKKPKAAPKKKGGGGGKRLISRL